VQFAIIVEGVEHRYLTDPKSGAPLELLQWLEDEVRCTESEPSRETRSDG
jgi:hypothetical protein